MAVFITPNLANATQNLAKKAKNFSDFLQQIFSLENFKHLNEELCYSKRERKFSLHKYIIIALTIIAGGYRYLTLHAINSKYRQETGSTISDQSIHEQLAKPETLKVVQLIEECMMKLTRDSNILDNNLELLIKLLNHTLGIESIIARDGTCIPVQPGCKNTMGASSMGRTKSDGSPAQPTIKAHLAVDGSNNIISHSITSSAAKGVSEISQTHPESYHNILSIEDRGYASYSHIEECAKNNNFYINKWKRNSIGEITKINYNRCKDYKKKNYIGKQIKKINLRCGEVLDVEVKLPNGNYTRMVIAEISNKRKHKNIVYLATNLPYEKVNADAVLNFYRLRWRQSEISNKCLKSGNSMQKINSNNKNIVTIFEILPCITFMLKKIFTNIGIMHLKEDNKNIKSQVDNIPVISILKIETFGFLCMENIFNSMKNYFKNFFEEICKFADTCLLRDFIMQRPSKRDISTYKDYSVLISQITSQIEN